MREYPRGQHELGCIPNTKCPRCNPLLFHPDFVSCQRCAAIEFVRVQGMVCLAAHQNSLVLELLLGNLSSQSAPF